jgi:superfamily II DNA/RNA helicase
MDKDSTVLNGRIVAGLAGQGFRNAAATLDAALALGGAVASVRLGPGRDLVLMAAIAARLEAEPGLKVLVVAPGDRDVAGLKAAFDAVGGSIGLTCSTIGRDGQTGDAQATIGSLDAVASCTASGSLDPRAFGMVALSDLDSMADVANTAMLRRALGSASSKRRLVAFSSELTPACRSIARDLGGAVTELELEAEGERAKNVPTATYSVSADEKLRLLLGLMASGSAKPIAVFCDLRDTAEAAAKQLRTRGIRTEYVLGNLPRKRAVLDSVKAGEYDVLVLTDEGASGLPGSWASVLVNWDLPLEGDPYLARLEHLDASTDGARVYNFACDRYSFGLPAIERVLGTRLQPLPAPESMMVAEGSGRSEKPGAAEAPDRTGMTRQTESDQQPRAQPDRNTERSRPDDRRDRGGHGSDRGGDRSDRGGQYDGRNARAIQADIAAITGGKPVAKAAAPVPVDAAVEPGARPGKKRGRKGRAGQAGAQKPASPEAVKRIVDAGRRREGTPPNRQGAKRARAGSGPRLTDPYSVSMEERLRLYRERYADGRGSGQPARSGGAKPGASRAAGKGRGGNPQQEAGKAGGTRPGQKRESAAPGNNAQNPSSRPEASQRASAAPAKGLFGTLKGLFGKKDE